MPQDQKTFENILAELIQKEMVIFGPNIALDKARKVKGLKIGNNGEVIAVTGNQALVLKALTAEYLSLSKMVAQMSINSVLEKYPEIKIS
jgi:hypothetical protein